jgi:hypothetical protein
MATLEDIRSYLQANPGMSDQQIAAAMGQYGVSPMQMAQATGVPIENIQQRLDAVSGQDQAIANRIAEIQQSGGSQYDIAREAAANKVSAADLARITGLSADQIMQMSGGVLKDSAIPPRPTFSGMVAEWNKSHEARFGAPVNLATSGQENLQRQATELAAETKRRQEEWDKTYGNTPEGKVIKENPPPDWRDIYEPWSQSYQKQFGNIIDRPWNTDEAAIKQKRELDDKYIKSIQDYNAKYGTNISPDPNVLGSFSQPSEFYKEPEKDKWYENPLNIAALAALTYFGAPYVTNALSSLGSLGAAEVLPAAGVEVFPLGELAVPSITSIPAVEAAGTLAASNLVNNLPVEIIDRSIPFDPKAWDAISTTTGLSNLAKAGLETLTQNPLTTLRTANTVKNIYDAFTGGGGDTGDLMSGVNKDTASLLAQGLSMLQPGQSQYALPGSLESTYLAPASGATQQQAQFLSQLKQLYPELRGADDNLLSTIASRTGVAAAKGGHIPEFITGATGHYVQGRGDGQSDEIPAMLADGEYVFDADTVAALGNGSNKAGAKMLDKMRENIREHKRKAPTDKIPPKAKSPLEYLRG